MLSEELDTKLANTDIKLPVNTKLNSNEEDEEDISYLD